jgi:hypothetical protein
MASEMKYRQLFVLHGAGLSLNDSHHVIVACSGDKKIQEYSTHGRLVHAIRLLDMTNPWHAVQLPVADDSLHDPARDRDPLSPVSAEHHQLLQQQQFVVTQFSSRGVVNVVNTNGQTVRTYSGPPLLPMGTTLKATATTQGTTAGLRYPTSVAVARCHRSSRNVVVVVADGNNNRILAVDAATMDSGREIPLPVAGGPQRPYGLRLDEARDRLYVAECVGCRVLVFDNVVDFLSTIGEGPAGEEEGASE